MVVPCPKVLSDDGVHSTGSGPSTVSIAELEKDTFAPASLVAADITSAGTVNTGDVVSFTVTVNEAELEFRLVSEASHVTTVAPSANSDPDADVQVVPTTPSTMSVAVAASKAATVFAPVA